MYDVRMCDAINYENMWCCECLSGCGSVMLEWVLIGDI